MPDEDWDDRLDELESKVEELESGPHGHVEGGVTVFYSLGVTLAAILSWDANRALLSAVIHGLLSWFYVIYYAVVHWANVKLL